MYNRKEIKVSPPAKNPGSPFGRDKIVANDGLFNPFVNKEVRVPSNEITMKGIPGNVLGIGSNGKQIMMTPGKEYNFGPDATYVDEIAMYRKGGQSPSYMDIEVDDLTLQELKDGGFVVEELPSMQTGGTKYTYGNSNYMKQGNKWLKEVNGKYVPLTQGNVQQRYDVLNKGAKPVFDKYADQEIGWQQAPTAPKPKPQTTEQKKAQQTFDKSFKVTAPSKAEKVEQTIAKQQQDLIDFGKERGIEITSADLDNVEAMNWNWAGVGFQKPPDDLRASTPQSNASRVWDVVTNPLDAFTYSIKGDLSDMPHNYNAMEAAGIQDPTVSGNSVAEALDFASYFTPIGMVAHGVKNVPHTASEINQAIQTGKSEDIWSAVGATGMNLLELAPGLNSVKQAAKMAPTVVSQLPQGLKNVSKGRATVGDLFKRSDLVVGQTPKAHLTYSKKYGANELSPTTGRFASQSNSPDAFKYLDKNKPIAYIKPQTKASAESFRISNQVDDIQRKLDKNPNYALTNEEKTVWKAAERSIFNPTEISKLESKGIFAEYPEEIVKGFKQMSLKPQSYWNEPFYRNNPALRHAAEDVRLASSHEFLLPKAPDPALFKNYASTFHIEEALANPWLQQSALGNVRALEESASFAKKLKNPLERGTHATMHTGSSEEEYQNGGTTGYSDMELTDQQIEDLKRRGFQIDLL
jgi:hypothetical protein